MVFYFCMYPYLNNINSNKMDLCNFKKKSYIFNLIYLNVEKSIKKTYGQICVRVTCKGTKL